MAASFERLRAPDRARHERQGPLSRRDAGLAIGPERDDADCKISRSRVAKGPKPIDDGRLVPRREDVARVGGVASIQQALVVRGVPAWSEHPVRPRPRGVHFVVGAEGDGDPGDDPRRGPPGVAAAFVMRGTTCSATARSSAIHRIVPDGLLAGEAEHHRAQGGEQHRVGAQSVTSIGLCTRYRRSRRPPTRASQAAFRTSR
jgi:hypothetical protein